MAQQEGRGLICRTAELESHDINLPDVRWALPVNQRWQ
jgi:hypothetical protein